MKARLTAGLIHKAQRGELALTLPTGLVRNGQGQVLKIPNQEVQARLALVFETFLQRIFPSHFGERRTISRGYWHSCLIM
jgi:DNA invertase Pin-like site-specific DNA recombinase